jgi:hypothetical protein
MLKVRRNISFFMVFVSFWIGLCLTFRSLSGMRAHRCVLTKECSKQNGIKKNSVFRPREIPGPDRCVPRVVQCA